MGTPEASSESKDARLLRNINDELPVLEEHEAEEVIVLDENDTAQKTAADEDADLDDVGYANMGNDEAEEPHIATQDDAVMILEDHSSETLAVACSPTQKQILITGGMDDVGHIWDLEMQRSLAKVDGGNDSVSTVAFSCDGKYAAFGSENGAISIVHMDGSTAPGTPLDGPGETINFLSWHPRGPVLLAGSADRVAYMWNAAKSTFMMAFIGHEDSVTCGQFSPDGKLVITASLDSSVRIWNPTTGASQLRIQSGVDGLRGVFHGADILCMDVGKLDSTASKLVATGCAAGDVFLSQRETGQIVNQLPRHKGGVETVAFSPKTIRPVLLASAGADGVVRVWDIEVGAERCKFTHGGGVVSKVVWHPTLPVIVSSSSDGSLILWNALAGEEVRKYHGHDAFISDVCFAGDSEYIASTSGDGSVRIFDARDALSQIK